MSINKIIGAFSLILATLVAGCAVDQTLQTPAGTDWSLPRNTAVPPHYTSEASLWQEGTTANLLFTDVKARMVNDLLTVIVVENSVASHDASTDLGRESDLSADVAAAFGGMTRLRSKNDYLPSDALVEGSFGSDFKGTGKTERSGRMTTKMTALVTDVLPNGNLMIEGTREVVLNDERQLIVLTGMVRPQDVSRDNTVLSTFIADARIQYTGSGVVTSRQRPGWGDRIITAVWPF